MGVKMVVVVAPDKFRGSLTAAQAAQAMAQGVKAARPSAVVRCLPMADGGEGTVDALVAATRGRLHHLTVTGPLGTPIDACFGMLGDGQTAVIEMAKASGLALIRSDQRDPLRTTTRGTGELLLAAIEAGARQVILGIGGSATNDGGAGFAQALGYRLLDARGRDLEHGGGPLQRLDRIESGSARERLAGIAIAAACDVDNPLCGPRGASAVYGPQKGATPEMVQKLDQNLAHLARVIERDLGTSVRDVPGAGAAGGLGAGLLAFASARLERGIELVIGAVGLAEALRGATLCLTGEGAFDDSSRHGKTAVGVARLAHSLGCPTIVLAGSVRLSVPLESEHGITAVLPIGRAPCMLDEALAQAGPNLAFAAEQVTRAFCAGLDLSQETRR